MASDVAGYHSAVPYKDLNVLDAAEQLVQMVNELIDQAPRGRLLHVQQLRDAVQSIVANIREGFGREPGGARRNSIGIARGETEEAIGHLRENFSASRVPAPQYWPIYNRLLVLSKMLTRLLKH
jgi:four helix bundle protein